MNSENVINKYKDEAPKKIDPNKIEYYIKKIEYYVKLFTENDVNEKTLTEFLTDNSFCTFGGGGWACPICSHGCFKINVMWVLKALEKRNKLNFTLDDFHSLEMKLSCNYIQENKE